MDCSALVLLAMLLGPLCAVSTHAEVVITDGSIGLGSTFSATQSIASANGRFELGLFAIPPGSSSMYLGIWYKDMQPFTQVWVANRGLPVSQAARFSLSAAAGLALLDNSTTVWSRGGNLKGSNISSCALKDEGNLVLLSSNETVAWQSFIEPADTWLPTMMFGPNMTLRSWRTPTDPSPGLYNLQMDSARTGFISVYNSSTIYWNTGPWIGTTFQYVPEMRTNFIYTFSFSSALGFNWTVKPDSGSMFNISRFVISPMGVIQQSSYDPSSKAWKTYWRQPENSCDVTGYCGMNGICNSAFGSPCNCLSANAFQPVKEDEWNENPQFSLHGCERIAPLNCEAGVSNDGFLSLTQTSFDMNSKTFLSNVSQAQCQASCLANCSCTAFYFEEVGSGNCSFFTQPLFNGKVPASTLGTFYVRVSAKDLLAGSSKKKLSVGVVTAIAVVGGLTIVLLLLACAFARRRRALRRALGSKRNPEGGLVAFSYAELQAATKNFRDKLGSGGFGTVYSGMVQDGVPVAVKKLQRLDEGDKQFRAEVKTIGTIQHVNLVRLLGFCSEGKHRLLVYELAENGSLDGALFHPKAATLDWRHRYDVALGTAKAVAYLHEACRECIIHCDIKPENVLLDAHYTAKVADFGLAKLIGREFSRVLTTVRGTRGYLAPEWIAGLPITAKADVYSFGMTLLELISGRRNIQAIDPVNSIAELPASNNTSPNVTFFPIFAAQVIHQPDADLLSLVDYRIRGDVNADELQRMLFAAVWCIQDNEEWRPTMGKVVQVLEGSLKINPPPVPTSLQCLIEVESSFSNLTPNVRS